jgi:hypothetical protein
MINKNYQKLLLLKRMAGRSDDGIMITLKRSTESPTFG